MRSPSPILSRGCSGIWTDTSSTCYGRCRRPTVCSLWCVKDIASHLLDGNIRRLSIQRDGHSPPDAPSGFNSHEDLLGYLNGLNADWTKATRRLSPKVLIRLLEVTGEEVAELFEASDSFGPATFAVAWAGESESPMWFDVAREFTERWHHQRQTASAVAQTTPIDKRRLYHQVLDAFMRALPYTFRDVQARESTTVCVRIVGDAGGEWFVRRGGEGWKLLYEVEDWSDAVVIIDQSIAWKLFTKRTDRATAQAKFLDIRIEGDVELGERVLEMVSIMANSEDVRGVDDSTQIGGVRRYDCSFPAVLSKVHGEGRP